MIQPTPDISCDAVRMFIKSIIAMDGRMISWITLDRILPEQEAEAA
jgi:purine-binding chemotaxis protein CheW